MKTFIKIISPFFLSISISEVSDKDFEAEGCKTTLKITEAAKKKQTKDEIVDKNIAISI
jgi:hypothetical protein